MLPIIHSISYQHLECLTLLNVHSPDLNLGPYYFFPFSSVYRPYLKRTTIVLGG